MAFIVAFLEWSAAVGVALCVPLLVRAWRAEVLRGDDPQFRPTGVFPRLVRALRGSRDRSEEA
ncbi:hypothetical protein GCM10009819_05300 [Agromyces tropicus]|uniref:Uncharacterized protein n=1 Tax=Agromyces tropicus TaxID=555371 RepID=A0ABP5FET1_9MICO